MVTRRSTGNPRSNGGSIHRTKNTNSHDKFDDIQFTHGTLTQVTDCLQSVNALAECAGTEMNTNMHRLIKRKEGSAFKVSKIPGRNASALEVTQHQEDHKQMMDKKDKCSMTRTKADCFESL